MRIAIAALTRCTAAAAAIAACLAAASAGAEPPDINRYCRAYHPHANNSYFSPENTVMFCINGKGKAGAKGAQGLLVAVDFAVACRLTNGSERFRYIDGLRIDCSRGPRIYVQEGPGVHILQPEDLSRYCEEMLAPGAEPEYSATLRRAVCVAEGFEPATINLALACKLSYRTDRVRYVDAGDRDHVACLA